jgi:hypothetical protein
VPTGCPPFKKTLVGLIVLFGRREIRTLKPLATNRTPRA